MVVTLYMCEYWRNKANTHTYKSISLRVRAISLSFLFTFLSCVSIFLPVSFHFLPCSFHFRQSYLRFTFTLFNFSPFPLFLLIFLWFPFPFVSFSFWSSFHVPFILLSCHFSFLPFFLQVIPFFLYVLSFFKKYRMSAHVRFKWFPWSLVLFMIFHARSSFFSVLYFFQRSSIFLSLYFTLFQCISFPSTFLSCALLPCPSIICSYPFVVPACHVQNPHR